KNAVFDAPERRKRHRDESQCRRVLCGRKNRHLGQSRWRAIFQDQSLDQFHRHIALRQAALSFADHARRTAGAARNPWLHHIGLERGAGRRSSDRTRGPVARRSAPFRSAQGRPNAAGECEGTAVKLRDLLPEAATDARYGAIDISGVTADRRTVQPACLFVAIDGDHADSRKVKPGFLFVAIAGAKADGAHFVRQAADAGAVAVVAEQKPEGLPDAIAFIRVKNPRRTLALTAAKFFPHQPPTIAPLTGTSGK